MVPGWLTRAVSILRLARVSAAFAAVSNVWFVILWSRAHPEEARAGPLWESPLLLLLVGGAGTAVGLYSFGATLNDLLDVSRDRALHRARPLASGRVSVEAASVSVAATLILAVLGSTVFGTRGVVLTVLLSIAILLFNVAGRFVPAVGLVLLALIYAAHSLVPNLGLRFVWPVWLIMTHALSVGWASHAIGRKVPPISQRAVFAAGMGWVAASAVLLWVGSRRSGPGGGLWPAWVDPVAAVLPVGLAAAFAIFAWRRVRDLGPGPRSAEKIARYGALWMPLYGFAWLAGEGLWVQAAVLGVLAGAAVLGLTLLREVYAVVERPMAFKR